jgi:hypothetical protein
MLPNKRISLQGVKAHSFIIWATPAEKNRKLKCVIGE